MKRLIFILLILAETFAFGQKSEFTLSGKVTDCKTHGLIMNVVISLVGSDGSSIETKTDSAGYYFFGSKKINKNRKYVIRAGASNESKVVGSKNKKGYLSSSDKIVFNTYDSIGKAFVYDFCLIKNAGCTLGPPIIYFKKNKTDFCDGCIMNDTIAWIVNMFNDNPNMIMEVGGHASKDEKKPQELGLKRANLIRDLLIKGGIEPGRLIAKSYSDSVPSYSYDEDIGEKTVFDKNDEASYQQNRRVVIIVVGRDYVSPNPPKKERN
jgi:outer membrane protein OmpA-like peptidoglycan-associated protein